MIRRTLIRYNYEIPPTVLNLGAMDVHGLLQGHRPLKELKGTPDCGAHEHSS